MPISEGGLGCVSALWQTESGFRAFLGFAISAQSQKNCGSPIEGASFKISALPMRVGRN